MNIDEDTTAYTKLCILERCKIRQCNNPFHIHIFCVWHQLCFLVFIMFLISDFRAKYSKYTDILSRWNNNAEGIPLGKKLITFIKSMDLHCAVFLSHFTATFTICPRAMCMEKCASCVSPICNFAFYYNITPIHIYLFFWKYSSNSPAESRTPSYFMICYFIFLYDCSMCLSCTAGERIFWFPTRNELFTSCCMQQVCRLDLSIAKKPYTFFVYIDDNNRLIAQWIFDFRNSTHGVVIFNVSMVLWQQLRHTTILYTSN